MANTAEKAVEKVPQLIKDLEHEDPLFRRQAARALGKIGEKAEESVSSLVDVLENDTEPKVRGSAAIALGKIGKKTELSVPALIKALDDEEVIVSSVAAEALVSIALKLQDKENLLPPPQLKKTINEFEKVEKLFNTDQGDNFTEEQKRSIRAALKAFKSTEQSNLPRKFIKKSSIILMTHSLCWILLIFLYPKSPQIQAIFFLNPWIRNFFGLGYVSLALTWIPFLRSKLLAPFKASLESDADLGSFDFKNAYFADLQVRKKPRGAVQKIQDAIP